MGNPSSKSPFAWRIGWSLAVVLLLGAVGCAAWVAISTSQGLHLAGCGSVEGADCDAVLQSPWAVWLGLPVAWLGLGLYGVFLGAWLAVLAGGGAGRAGWRVAEVCVPAALGGALWFVGLQAFALGHWCPWCMAVHTCGTLAALLAMLTRAAADTPAPSALLAMRQAVATPGPARQWDAPALGLPTLAGVLGLAALVGGQVFLPPQSFAVLTNLETDLDFDLTSNEPAQPPDAQPSEAQPSEAQPEPTATAEGDATQDSAESQSPTTGFEAPEIPSGPPRLSLATKMITVLDGKLRLDAYDHPILGSPEAEKIVVEFMDYACPHCREAHGKIAEALRRFDGRVAVIVLPWPGEILCNKYIKSSRPKSRGACEIAKLSIAVARAEPAAFPPFHAWLLHQEDKLPRFIEARLMADRFVVSGDVRKTLNDRKTLDLQKQYIELFGQLNRTRPLALPCQIVGRAIVAGAPDTVDRLVEVWQQNLEIDPAPTAQAL